MLQTKHYPRDRFSNTTESEPEDNVDASRTAEQSGDQGSIEDDAENVEAEGSPFVASDTEGELTRGADEVVAQSTSSDSQAEGSGHPSETSTGSARESAQDERDPAGETSGGSSASDTTSEPRVSPPDGSNTPNAFDKDDSGENAETTVTDSDTAQASENSDDIEEDPDGPQPGHSGKDTASVDEDDEAGETAAESADGESTTADEGTPDDSGGVEGPGSDPLSDEDMPNDLDQEALEAVSAVGSDTEKPGEETADTSNTHPTDVELDAPFHESYSTLSIEEREEADLSEDDEKFMALVADAFSGNLADYTLGESMTGLKKIEQATQTLTT